jgi:hypothetical protein
MEMFGIEELISQSFQLQAQVAMAKLMLEIWRVRNVLCTSISLFLHSGLWNCHYYSAYVAAASM